MKKALITGSSGFIGRNFLRHLESQGWSIWGGDLLEGIDVLDLLRSDDDTVFDLVIHAAYHVGGRAAIDGVNMNLAKNLELDAALFQWAVRTSQRRVIYFSSSAAYPLRYQTQDWVQYWGHDRAPLEEVDIEPGKTLTPDAHYGWAKLTGERLAEVARANGVPVTVVRPFSGYGEDQSLDYPFPSIVNRVLAGDYTVWGIEGQTRDWIHIDDVIAATMAIVESGTHLPINICTGRGVEMGELVRMVAREAHGLAPVLHDVDVTYLPDKPMGVFCRVGDPSLMHQYYTPKITVEEGISRALKGRV